MDKLDYELKPVKKIPQILCTLPCMNFEDTGLRDVIMYSSRGKVKGRVQVRYFCKAYQEYLTKFYSVCVRYE